MPIDLSKLAPAPWKARDCEVESAPINEKGDVMMIYDEGGHNEADAAFIALARNAFDVMMRRGWGVENRGGWYATSKYGDRAVGGTDLYPDPFTALVEADAWYKQNVEAAPEAK